MPTSERQNEQVSRGWRRAAAALLTDNAAAGGGVGRRNLLRNDIMGG